MIMNNIQKFKQLLKTAGLLLGMGAMIISYQSCAQWLGASAHSSDTAASVTPTVAVVPFSAAEPILAYHCASCHSPTSGNTAAIAAISNITNQTIVQSSSYVKMGTPQTSTLYLDIIDGVMPQNLSSGGVALSQGEIETIREWLLAQNINTDVLAGTLPPTSGVPGSSGGGGTTSGPVSFSTQIAPIIAGNCAGCHGANAPSLGSYAQISAVGSQIVTAITSNNAALLMPPGEPLSAADITLIESWVNAGAPNN
jgi:hypothetical protein